MKDQYAGDFGDFVKLAMLRSLGADRRLCVAWYRTPDDPSRHDGRHVQYLDASEEHRWRPLDPDLYDQLRQMVGSGTRTIGELQRIMERPGAEFFDHLIESRSARAPWFALLSAAIGPAELIFLDPDNGIASPGFAGSTASVTCDEIEYLRGSTRTAIVYHHHTRAKGGHLAELNEIAGRLMPSHTHQAVCALRAPGWSPRSFFIIGPARSLWERAEQFARDWAPHVTFHALTPPPDEIGLTPGHDAYERVDMLDARGILDLAADRLLDEIGPIDDDDRQDANA